MEHIHPQMLTIVFITAFFFGGKNFFSEAMMFRVVPGQDRPMAKFEYASPVDWFTCPEKNGLYPHPTDCNSFVQCYYRQPYFMKCPINFRFNSLKRSCDWQSLVECSTGTASPVTGTSTATTPNFGDEIFCSNENIAIPSPDCQVKASSFLLDWRGIFALRPFTTVCSVEETYSLSICSGDSNYWHSGARPPQWLRLDFQTKPRRVCAFSFGTRVDDSEGNVARDAPIEYSLQYADASPEYTSSWRTVASWRVFGSWTVNQIRSHTLDASVVKEPHRFWRFLVTDVPGRPDGSKFVVVRDFQMFAFEKKPRSTISTFRPSSVSPVSTSQISTLFTTTSAVSTTATTSSTIFTTTSAIPTATTAGTTTSKPTTSAPTPCLPNPCLNGGACTASGSGFVCVCSQGFTGSKCERQSSPCDAKPCVNGGVCYAKADGGFRCDCHYNFVGPRCETSACDAHCVMSRTARCVPSADAVPVCVCELGYSGAKCEINDDDCAAKPCFNGAQCRDKDPAPGFECLCPAGWEGPLCNVDINDCAAAPCLNGGRCEDRVGTFFCDCSATSYVGTRCEKLREACSTAPCKNGGKCVGDNAGGYRCECPDAFVGLNCETPYSNPCSSAACVATNGICLIDDTRPDNYRCACHDGFLGTFCQKDTKALFACPAGAQQGARFSDPASCVSFYACAFDVAERELCPTQDGDPLVFDEKRNECVPRVSFAPCEFNTVQADAMRRKEWWRGWQGWSGKGRVK